MYWREGRFTAQSGGFRRGQYNGVKNVLPDAYLETIRVGDPLVDDWINPYAFPYINRYLVHFIRRSIYKLTAVFPVFNSAVDLSARSLIYNRDPSRVLSREKIPAELPVVAAAPGWEGGKDLLNGSGGVHPERITSRL